jgi:hypothetical protein
MRPDHERLQALLTDTVTCLCRNGLQFQQNICVQGLLGITLDNNEVFIVHINETMTASETGAVRQMPVHMPQKSHHLKPTKRLFGRESFKFGKRYSVRPQQPSRTSAMLNESSSERAASNSQGCIEDSPKSNEVQSEKWKLRVDETVSQNVTHDIEEPIEIKSEPDTESINFEQLSEFDTENNDNNDCKLDAQDIHFHGGSVDSHIPNVTNKLSNKRSHQFSVDSHFNNGSSISARTSQHSYPVGYAGEGYETGHTSSWTSGLQSVSTASHTQVGRFTWHYIYYH